MKRIVQIIMFDVILDSWRRSASRLSRARPTAEYIRNEC
jgi:hypothetical protein